MPFTFSHPAIILPLTLLSKRWISITGFVIGSLTPDFEYFIRMNIRSDFSHSLLGVLWFDLPLGILLSFVFHNIIRNSFLDNFICKLKIDTDSLRNFNWNTYFKNNWLKVIVSIIIGAYSHIFWDSFTHSTGYFVVNFPMLLDNISILGFQIKIYSLLQHVSTLIGGIVLIYVLINFRVKKTISNSIIKYWGIVMAISLTLFCIRYFADRESMLLGTAIVTIISTSMIALIITSLLLKNKTD